MRLKKILLINSLFIILMIPMSPSMAGTWSSPDEKSNKNIEPSLDISDVDVKITYDKATTFFNQNLYDEAAYNYYKIINTSNLDKTIEYNSWKNLGIIFLAKKNYPRALDHLKRARNIKDNKEIKELISKIDISTSGKYIIQVGIFNSAYNANQIIKNIIPINDDFTLVKEKQNGHFVVFFDNLKDKTSADSAAERLKALNSNINFFVKEK